MKQKILVSILFIILCACADGTMYGQESSPEFQVVEKVPVYPGCESFTERKILQKCMQIKISAFVTMEINTSTLKNLIKGKIYKTYVYFTVDEQGKLSDIKVTESNHSNKGMKRQIIRAVKKLPRMEPGTQKGKAVRVKYSLPIHIKVSM